MKLNNSAPIFFSLLCALSVVSCSKKFDNMNVNPILPTQATPGVILGQMEYQMVNAKMEDARSFTHILMQVMAPRSDDNIDDVMRWFVAPGTDVWENYYKRLADVQDLYTISGKLNERNYMAIALVCKTYMFAMLTDLHGDIPYSQATQGEQGNFLPAFDKQKDIYQHLLEDLEKADTLFDVNNVLSFGGDPIYHGETSTDNMFKWKKFCNSLRLRLLLRIIKRDGEINVSQQISTILADPKKYPLFTSNDDEAILRYTDAYPYTNPFFSDRALEWSDGTYFTTFFMDKMNTDNDPRRILWARTINVNGQNIYRGIPTGYVTGTSYDVNANSNFTDALKALPQLGVLMTYSELEFIMAELELKGFHTGNSVAAHYNNGITASMIQWGVTMPAGYLQEPGVVFNTSASADGQLEQIILQKYYSFFFADYQSWFEKRRTGYPVLAKGPGIPADRQFPRRMPYPLYLQSLNADNLKQAVAGMGGDDCYIRVWWDKE